MQTIPTHLMIGVLLSCGLLLGMAATRLGLPRVAAYVLAGVLVSPSLLGGLIGLRADADMDALTSTALGIIAYLIGGSITSGQLRRAGRVILSATLGETLGAALLVWLVMRVAIGDDMPAQAATHLALAFAAVSATTAPAATVAVLHQYRARGPLSDALLGVVALDDAVGIMLFAVVAVFTTGADPYGGIGWALIEILGSIALGAMVGFVLSRLAWMTRPGALRLPVVMAGILLTIGAADAVGFSPLLASMALGFSARQSLGAAADRLFAPIEDLEEFVFLIFFTLAGAHFDPHVFSQHLDWIGAYLIARVAGKVAGASIGARAAGAPRSVVRWLGLTLVPQAGVAVGLALILGREPAFAGVAPIFLNVILGTTVVYEVVGPLVARLALERAGELGEKRERT